MVSSVALGLLPTALIATKLNAYVLPRVGELMSCHNAVVSTELTVDEPPTVHVNRYLVIADVPA